MIKTKVFALESSFGNINTHIDRQRLQSLDTAADEALLQGEREGKRVILLEQSYLAISQKILKMDE